MISEQLKEKWSQMNLMEQLGNLGSEISRAIHWLNKDQKIFDNTVNRALELFDLILEDSRWNNRHQEVARAREVFCDIIFGENCYKSSLPDLLRYFDQFAYMIQKNKTRS